MFGGTCACAGWYSCASEGWIVEIKGAMKQGIHEPARCHTSCWHLKSLFASSAFG